MTREQHLQASCQSIHSEYKQCLATSNRDPRKCADYVPKLRACEKSLNISYCIDETNNLMKCARRPDASVCSKEFLLMRECNRPGGPHLLLTTDAQGAPRYEVQPQLIKQFTALSPDVGPAEAPVRSKPLMQQTIDQLKQQANAKAFDFVPYAWESLRSSPGK
ncbi:uncharacterized protein LOC34621484 [Cyclospora cayetanensis]|uniref:Uncharacterized protein LOC34621484 n=2 Tax=Cyclospora cayetanensis TaxID=88456 RepID=A0A6P5WFR7_9EIME|nr:uncharacterized protein LOC34621484 [Cyclospora cayetanensis]OEH78217.1 hypothetical protein cyc_05065 [Cyclospora cayetanensis]